MTATTFARRGYHAVARWFPKPTGMYIDLRTDVVFCRVRDERRAAELVRSEYEASSIDIVLSAQAGSDPALGRIDGGAYAFRLRFHAGGDGMEPDEIDEAQDILRAARRRAKRKVHGRPGPLGSYADFVVHWLRALGVDDLYVAGGSAHPVRPSQLALMQPVKVRDGQVLRRTLERFEAEAVTSANFINGRRAA